jgi:hypothetical protein
MNIQILNFYFQKNGYGRNANKMYFNYFKNGYEVKIFRTTNKAIIIKDGLILFETGIPTNEASIVKWINILIAKHENQND